MRQVNRPSRRQLVQAGCVGTMGLTLPDLLMAQTVHRPASSAKSCIFIYQYGGLSQLDSWDPKPEGPGEIRGPYQTIPTRTPGFRVGELMPRLARLSDKYSVIRSMTHDVSVHHTANQMLLAGQSKPASDAPAFGSKVAKIRPATANVPDYVWLQKFGGGAMPAEHTYLTGGNLGMKYAPMLIGKGHDDNPANPDFRVSAFDPVGGMSESRLRDRRRLLTSLQGVGNGNNVGPSMSTDSLTTFQDKAFSLLAGSQAKQAFDINRETEQMRDRYGRHPFGQNLLMSRRLIEAGVRLVSVVAWMGLAPNEKFLSVETWDMHGNAGIGIFDNGWNGLGWALPRADASVATLLEDLESRGLLDSTLVVLVGEFGRTPRISKGAKAIGRDHWPACYSAMVAGGGIRSGVVYGESDKQAAYVKDNPVTLEDFTATLLEAMDIHPETRLSKDGFTQPASTGTPIKELLV